MSHCMFMRILKSELGERAFPCKDFHSQTRSWWIAQVKAVVVEFTASLKFKIYQIHAFLYALVFQGQEMQLTCSLWINLRLRVWSNLVLCCFMTQNTECSRHEGDSFWINYAEDTHISACEVQKYFYDVLNYKGFLSEQCRLSDAMSDIHICLPWREEQQFEAVQLV